MHTSDMSPWTHDHLFGQHQARPGERRTLIIVVVTAVFMVVEIIAGLYYGSMALLADGLHMASHAAALGIASGPVLVPWMAPSPASLTSK